ncbi:hypothetical protein C8T65DRAFT_235932 [Cerioporus squamosus]|nr:hypothetical protein C8T65DRAFT_235932 [Cerioporus squamosus]
MTSTSAPAHIPFRVFSSPDVHDGAAVALGRNHASWFLVLARPDGLLMTRAIYCLNFVLPNDAIGAQSTTGQHLFVVGGQLGDTIMTALTSLLDQEGRAPVEIVEAYPEDHPLGLCALVEVQVPDEELLYACARCGRWEAQLGPRFLPCGGRKSRYYCSTKCQKDDWQPAFHREECMLLKDGKAHEVENRRKLHDNGWWFVHGSLGIIPFMAGTGEYDCERASSTGDWDYLAYGRHTPPPRTPLARNCPGRP